MHAASTPSLPFFTRAPQAGVIDFAVDALSELSQHAAVCRQACLLVRNMAVRNPELRPVLLEKGA